MKGLRWTASEDAEIVARYPREDTSALAASIGRTVRAVHTRARALGVRKDPDRVREMLNANGAELKRMGAETRFRPGHRPWNAGISYQPKGGSLRTRFRPGRPPETARNYRPIGSLRISCDGYLQRKVTDDQSIAPAQRWTSVHRLVWVEAHGPVPPGHVVVFRPGRRTTELEQITLDAVELISRVELQRRNSIHRLPPELVNLCQTRGALNRRINRKLKEITHAKQDV